MRRRIKIAVTIAYTTVFLLFASTGALRLQAAEAEQFCPQAIAAEVAPEMAHFFQSLGN